MLGRLMTVQRLLRVRRRYDALRGRLDPSLETDRCLHTGLTEAIRALDRKIARLSALHGPRVRAARQQLDADQR